MKRILQSTILLIFLSAVVLPQTAAVQIDGAIVENESCAANTVGEFEQYVESSVKAYAAEVASAKGEGFTMENPADLGKYLLSKNELERRKSYKNFECRRIKYMSDGLKVAGYIWKPKKTTGKKLPLIIYNRGGNREFGIKVSGNNNSGVFQVNSVTVVMRGFTIRGGFDTGGGGGVNTSGNLTLENMTVTDNTAVFGGGIASFGNTTLINTIVSGNTATGGDGNNFGGGGGIYAAADSAKTLTLTNVVLSNNKSAFNGGGLFSDNPVIVNNSTIADNSVTDNGGGGAFFGLGGFRISGTTFSGNTAANGFGGGFTANSGAGAGTVVNSTISGNTARDGGGIADLDSVLTLRNLTVAENTATVAGGGINNIAGTINIANTIVANNAAPTNSDINGAISSLGNNLVRTRGTSTGYAASDLPNGVNPLLGALINNGGATQTRAPAMGSPAIDAGSNAQALGTDDTTLLTTDQRGAGFPRVVGAAVDIGAFEYSPPLAASVSVGGRVTSADGRAVRNALVTLTSANGASRTIVTGKLGAYRFTDVAAGETYIIGVSARRFRFALHTRIRMVNENINDVDFIADN